MAVTATFPVVDLATIDIRYRVSVVCQARRQSVNEFLRHTDAIAEIQSTVLSGVPVARMK